MKNLILFLLAVYSFSSLSYAKEPLTETQIRLQNERNDLKAALREKKELRDSIRRAIRRKNDEIFSASRALSQYVRDHHSEYRSKEEVKQDEAKEQELRQKITDRQKERDIFSADLAKAEAEVEAIIKKLDGKDAFASKVEERIEKGPPEKTWYQKLNPFYSDELKDPTEQQERQPAADYPESRSGE